MEIWGLLASDDAGEQISQKESHLLGERKKQWNIIGVEAEPIYQRNSSLLEFIKGNSSSLCQKPCSCNFYTSKKFAPNFFEPDVVQELTS